MKIIKLNATPSTNDYLKTLSQNENIENFCCVVAEDQTEGRGQMGAQWASDKGKNLTFSVYIEKVIFDIKEIYLLNVAVAVCLYKVLDSKNIPKLSIKWPNDIMAENKKIGGILIENIIRGDGGITSIVGIGLNVNQTNFVDIPTASSMTLAVSKSFNQELLLVELLSELENTIVDMFDYSTELWSIYKSNLFKRDVPMAFEKVDGEKLMGIIKDVSPQGLLIVEHDDDIQQYYNIKEIKMLY